MNDIMQQEEGQVEAKIREPSAKPRKIKRHTKRGSK